MANTGTTESKRKIWRDLIMSDEKRIERCEWCLWCLVLLVTLLLAGAILSFGLVVPWRHESLFLFPLGQSAKALLALILVFDFYIVYQQVRLHRIRRQLRAQEDLTQLVGEHAADMIAVVDMSGRRLYNSPAYGRILGYSAEELKRTAGFEQIHPEDRQRVITAAEDARRTGLGTMLQYRMRHKDGTWRTLESSASVVRNSKGHPDKLVIVNRDITERKRMEEQLIELRWTATHDLLTGLPNRLLCEDRLQRAVARATRHDRQMALLCIDVDRFKGINDQYGHDAGDDLLKQVGTRLGSKLRSTDTVARFGGDEFLVIIEDIQRSDDVKRIAAQLLAATSEPAIINGSDCRMSVSIGVAIFPSDGRTPEALKQNADYAMYRAKSRGGNDCEIFSGKCMGGEDSNSLESYIQNTVNGDGLDLFYQPQLTPKGELAGLEALLRFQDPRLQRFTPSEFISLAEHSGFMVPIGEWVLREACRQSKAWQSQGFAPVRIAVNVSSVQLASRDFAERVELILKEANLSPTLLELELTESVLIADIEDSVRQLRRLENLGIRIAIDDFGKGYSSLAYLHRLPIHTIKVDRSFVQQIDSSTSSLPIIQAIAGLGRSLGLTIIAEGVETEHQASTLNQVGCDLFQGYFFSRPKPAADLREMLPKASDSDNTCAIPVSFRDRIGKTCVTEQVAQGPTCQATG